MPAAFTPAFNSSAITPFLVDHARSIRCDALPSEVAAVAKQSLLDWFGVTLAARDQALVHKLLEEARFQGAHPRCTVVGFGEKTSPAWAALVNGAAADAADFSDVHLAMHGHPTAAVAAAALAAAELHHATGAQLLSSLVAGIELECRVGLYIQPESYERTGFHPTGPVAHFGATAAAAHLMGLEREQWIHALGLAATQAAGLKASAGTMGKPAHCGFAAMHGVMGASLARRGFVASQEGLESPTGFGATHSPVTHPGAVLASKDRFLVLDTAVKRYAACALTHGTIRNLQELRASSAPAAEVTRIVLRVPAGHLKVVGHREARTELEAKFSLWATAALAFLGADMGAFATYHDASIARSEVRRLMQRIEVIEDASLDFSVSHASVELTDGRRLEASADTSEPERDPVKRARHVSAKFHALSDPVLGIDKAHQLEQSLLSLERLESIHLLFDLSTRGPST